MWAGDGKQGSNKFWPKVFLRYEPLKIGSFFTFTDNAFCIPMSKVKIC